MYHKIHSEKNKDVKITYVLHTMRSRAFIRFSWGSVSGTYMSTKVHLVGKARIKKTENNQVGVNSNSPFTEQHLYAALVLRIHNYYINKYSM